MFVAIAYASVSVREIFRDFNMVLFPSWQVRVINLLQPTSTIAFGACVAAMILWKDRVTNLRLSRYINILAFVVLFFVFVIWLVAAFSPMFYEARVSPTPP